MSTLSPHFERREFKCRCGCGFDTVDIETLEVLEQVRQHFKKPVTVTSGCRCPAYNRKVGGVDNSFHVLGRAADIHVHDTDPDAVYDFLITHHPNAYGFGLYPEQGFVHIDTRSNGPARWGGWPPQRRHQ